MKISNYKKFIFKYKIEILIGIISSVASVLMAWYVYAHHLMVTLADQAAHLVFARLLTDSLTPGITQLGIWPPLLHVIMMPAAAIRPLFETGLAGVVTLLPIFVVGVIFLYHLAYELTKDKTLSFVASLIYILNPYVLYYAVTPMMEVLFITMVIAVAYYFVLWLEYNQLRHLLLAGIFVAFASLARYEGLFLVPVVFVIVIMRLFFRRKKYYEIEAVSIIFGSLAMLGLGYIIVYNWAFTGNPFSFAGIGITDGWDLAKYASTNITKHNLFQSLNYMIHSSYYMIGKIFTIISLFGFFIIIPFSFQRLKVASTISILLVPFLAVALALYRGSSSIEIPDFSLSKDFHNERYALSWIGFASITPILVVYYFCKNFITKLFFIILLIVSAFSFTYYVIVVDNFSPIRGNITTKNREHKDELALQLRKNYDFGKILAIRFGNDFTYVDGDVSLKTYIYEGNYKYFDQALAHPWIFARWLVMLNPKSHQALYSKDPIKDKCKENEEFNRYYILISQDQGRDLYRINKDAVTEYAKNNNLDPNKIPSLNTSITKWNPDTIWQEMQRN